MNPSDMEDILKALEVFQCHIVQSLHARGWTDADIERGMDLMRIVEASGVDVDLEGPCLN